MPVTAKPFSRALKLARMVFKPRPNIFSDQDLTRATDMLNDKAEQALLLSGSFYQGLSVSFENVVITFDPEENNWDIAVDLSGGGSSHYFYHKGVRFTVPAFSESIALTGIANAAWKKRIYGCLIAEKTTENSPVTSSEYPTSLPGPDITTWGGERVVFTHLDPADISLDSGEELVGVFVVFKQKSDITIVDSVPTEGTSWELVYAGQNLDNPTENSQYAEMGEYIDVFSNKSLWEMCVAIVDEVRKLRERVTLAVVSTISATKLWTMLKYNGTTYTGSNILDFTTNANYFIQSVTGMTSNFSADVFAIKSFEPKNTSLGTLLAVRFTQGATLYNNFGAPVSGFKKIKFFTPLLNLSDVVPSSLPVPLNSVVYFRELTDGWYVENVFTPDSILRDAFGIGGYHETLNVDIDEEDTFTVTIAEGGTALFKFNNSYSAGNFSPSGSSAYNTSSGVFTVPKTGLYRISTLLQFAGLGSDSEFKQFVMMRVSGSYQSHVIAADVHGSTSWLVISGSRTLPLIRGEQYTFRLHAPNDVGVVFQLYPTIITPQTLVSNTMDIEFVGTLPSQYLAAYPNIP